MSDPLPARRGPGARRRTAGRARLRVAIVGDWNDDGTIMEAAVADTSVTGATLDKRDAESHGAVQPAAHHPAPRYNPDAPSEEWGWHGSWREFAPRGSSIILALGIFLLFMLNFTDHESHVENVYFNGIALLGVLYLICRIRSGRKMRQRAADRHHGDQ